MKIVKFKNGKYGIRKLSLFGWRYADLEVPYVWWFSNSPMRALCCYETYKEVKIVFKAYNKMLQHKKEIQNMLKDRGEPI